MHPTPSARRLSLIGALLALVLALAGCGGGTEEPAGGGGDAAPTAQDAAPTSGQEAGAEEVTVTMTEMNLELSEDTFTPGTYTFTATNEGQFPHTITIDGPGVAEATAGGPAAPGETVSLTVDLQPGTYEMWCPVMDHRGMGMTTTITVA